jgi:hypothetical protein
MAKRTMKQATISMKLMFIFQNFGKDKQKHGAWSMEHGAWCKEQAGDSAEREGMVQTGDPPSGNRQLAVVGDRMLRSIATKSR